MSSRRSHSQLRSGGEGPQPPPQTSDKDEALAATLATPTPAARIGHHGGTRLPSRLAAELTPSSPAAAILATPARSDTRRLLFPEAPYSGDRSRPFPPLAGGTSGGGDTTLASTSPNFTPVSSASFPARPPPVYRPAGLRVAGPSTLPSWLVGSASVKMEALRAEAGLARASVGNGSSTSRPRGNQDHGVVAVGGFGTSSGLDNFVQHTDSEPESSSVPFGPLGFVSAPVAGPATGWVESMVIDPTNPYASFLRANNDVLAGGSGVVVVQPSQGGGGGGGSLSGHGVEETEMWTRDEVCEESELDTSYPQRFLSGAIPSVSRAATLYSTTSSNQRALSSSMFEMQPPAFSFLSGSQPGFNPDPTNSAAVSSGQNNAGTFHHPPPVDLSNSLIDPDLFATTSQQLPLDQLTDQNSDMGRMEEIDPSAVRRSIEEDQCFQQQLMQIEPSTPANTESSHHPTANQFFVGTARIDLSYQTAFASDFHFGTQKQPQDDNMSTIAHTGSDLGAAELARALSEATSAGYYGSCVDNGEEHDGDDPEDDDSNSEENYSSEHEDGDSNSEDEEGEHMPHVPAVHPDFIYDPNHNPAAAYWSPLPGDLTIDGYALPWQPPQAINMYDPLLPTFDTDPFLPFAPWRVNQLPPFIPEPTNRVITITARNLAAVGQLYPDATFLVSRYPASRNTTVRIKGSALATSAALHLPTFTDPAQSHTAAQHDNDNNHGNDAGDDGPTYIAALAQRDWPIGGVAFFPHTTVANTFVAALQGAFDVLPRGQEAFYFLPHDVRCADGSVGAGRGVWVCRAYEGRQGPQDRRLVERWMVMRGAAGAVPEEDGLGREVLVRMGEAWVEPEKWPRVGRGRKRGGGGGGM
ncbi:hypothetical protein B0I37DRAFT_446648 [Chaetomium sp. MPI-CAGE-AT-0009]|nr:hypothetical protein B0I37DRAFT_446648 [Chaetomium sp. MPI-CAGE-AT-0009]